MVEQVRRRSGAHTATCVTVIGVLAAVCFALAGTVWASSAAKPPGGEDGAQEQPASKQAQRVAQVPRAPKSKKNLQAAPAGDAGCGSKPSGRKGLRSLAKRGGEGLTATRTRGPGGPEVATGPPWPGWTCEEKDLTLDPIWSEQPLSATWVVRNDGEGDLQIKVKGG